MSCARSLRLPRGFSAKRLPLPWVRFFASIAAMICLIFATTGHAQEPQDGDAPDDEPVAPQRLFMEEAQFEQWIYGGRPNAAEGRKYLETQLDLRIQTLDRVCTLTKQQKEKLLLAGRGDIKHLFDRAAVVKKNFQTIKNDQNKFHEIVLEVQPLQLAFQKGAFGSDSLLSKTLKRTLNETQAATVAELDTAKAQYRMQARVELYVAMLDEGLALRAEQRERLVRLLLEELKPAPENAPGGINGILMQAIRLPEAKLKPLLDDHQWQMFRRTQQMFGGMAVPVAVDATDSTIIVDMDQAENQNDAEDKPAEKP
jgi:hypothetical protein